MISHVGSALVGIDGSCIVVSRECRQDDCEVANGTVCLGESNDNSGKT